MTFMGKNGTQYVVVAAGGPGDTDRGGTEQYPQKLVAFALSDRTTTTADPPAAPKPISGVAAAPAPQTAGAGTPMASAASLAEGKALTEKVCTQCHGLEAETANGRTLEGWKAVVDEMIAMGANANETEAKIITDYLSRAFPPKR
jgi:cytochrome c5